jgi:ATP-dependent Clp protease ATP-binding subunit ClpX
VDTSNILFICGGAFVGLDDTIGQRTGKKVVGFGSPVKGKKETRIGDVLSLVEPEDLIKFGMIPEFVGRMPVVAALDELDKDALITILTEPRNALIKQYQKLMALDGVKLSFTDGALDIIAQKAIDRKAGARGLRAVLEEVMLEVMYELPSRKNIKECVINEDVIRKHEMPVLVFEKQSA